MTVSREDIEGALEQVQAWFNSINYDENSGKTFKYKDGEEVMYKCGEVIRQVLEDRLNQVDYKSLAEEQNKVLEEVFEVTSKGYISNIVYEAISKYEQAIKGEK